MASTSWLQHRSGGPAGALVSSGTRLLCRKHIHQCRFFMETTFVQKSALSSPNPLSSKVHSHPNKPFHPSFVPNPKPPRSFKKNTF